jgi:hypothetical protein
MMDFPATLGLASDDVEGLIVAAGLAPSLHNSQPWQFNIRPDMIELYNDPELALPAADPTGREQRLACGAALYNLRLALQCLGIRPLVTHPADPNRPDLLARVRHGGRRQPTPEQLRLLRAIPLRRTNRHPFTDESVTPAERMAMRRAALEEGAVMQFVDDPAQRAALQQVAGNAHAVQQADPAFRAEEACWIAVAPGRSDGVPAHPGERRPSAHERWVKRDFTGSQGRAAVEVGAGFEQEPTIAILSAHLFGSGTGVATGQAMQRVLLTATTDGLSASFLSHMIEVDSARLEMQRILRGLRGPQVVLRIGRGWPVSATPRRPVRELLRPGLPTTV